MTALTKCYSDLVLLNSFEDRLAYLRLYGDVGDATFGFDRWVNQRFYMSAEWRYARDVVILRDQGCDLGIPGYEIYENILIHHINPMKLADIEHNEAWIFDPEYLITTTQQTHNAIHYGSAPLTPRVVTERSPRDTRLW